MMTLHKSPAALLLRLRHITSILFLIHTTLVLEPVVSFFLPFILHTPNLIKGFEKFSISQVRGGHSGKCLLVCVTNGTDGYFLDTLNVPRLPPIVFC